MNNQISNLELSYKMQSENFSHVDEETIRLQKTWFEEDTVDYWRHYRMFSPLKSILLEYPYSNWLTVGDGRYGLDSVLLKKMQSTLQVLPTDLSTVFLSKAKEMKLINDYRGENAESLSFPDNSFDFSFCKEAYHHFPRPYMAIYEMLRVSKKGIVFVEPSDKSEKKFPELILKALKRAIKKIIGKADLNSRFGLQSYSNIIVLLFNEMPRIKFKNWLKLSGFRVINLPEISYFKKRKEELARS